MRKQRVTIREVAKLAGVSTGTVSRVLNGRPGVHPQTRARVLEVVRALGYVPNPVARELTGRGERTVGVLQLPGVPRLTPYFTLLYEYLADALWQEGFRLREVPTDPVGLPLEPAKGYVLLGAHEHDPRIEYLQEHGQPFVLVGVYPGAFWVAPHDEEGGYLATRHLLELGHREILHLTGHLHNQAGRDRLAGYRRALEAYGVPFRPELVLDGEFSVLSAYRVLRRAWEGGLRGTAIFAASDEMAVGARAALEDLGAGPHHRPAGNPAGGAHRRSLAWRGLRGPEPAGSAGSGAARRAPKHRAKGGETLTGGRHGHRHVGSRLTARVR